MKVIILDGYNVIHAIPALEALLNTSLQRAREELFQVCQAILARRRDIRHIYIVFDGQRGLASVPADCANRLTVLFSQKPEQADDLILSLIRSEAKDDLWVITQDVEIVNNARALCAKVADPRDFFSQMFKVQAGNRPEEFSKRISEKLAKEITEEYRKQLGLGPS